MSSDTFRFILSTLQTNHKLKTRNSIMLEQLYIVETLNFKT